jgi:hypothetical protein
MKRIFFIIWSLSFLLLNGCAVFSPTPYQPMNNGARPDQTYGGYSNMALASDIYKVSFLGNGLTSSDTVQNYLIRRCAELTIQKGYRYFVILGSNMQADRHVFTTPTTINTNNTANVYGTGTMYGNSSFKNYSFNGSGYSNTNTVINPGTTYNFTKYNAIAAIKLLNDNKNFPLAFDANVILSNY